eukprot:Skav236662  [mRNA]  locus=scaffold3354:125145:125378:+ [translate_table: standard]
MADPKPFTIHVPDDVLDDLHSRLQRARVVPDNVGAGLRDPNGAWAYGTDKATLEEYVQLAEEPEVTHFCSISRRISE